MQICDLTNEHNLCVEEDFSRKIHFSLRKLLNNVWRIWHFESVEYDASRQKDVKCKDVNLKNVMEPEAHAHFFCSAV